ncbi:hypothetical protein CEB3_c21800 [Peptococcaceae bacterium CEB3]|nr:hypothetical protein CEB3_c21800 [Peptococcaceae bacterium CEB3]
MGGEKEIWLGEEEIDSLLRGKMSWSDVVPRTAGVRDTPRIRRLGEPRVRPRSGGGAGVRAWALEHIARPAERSSEADFRAEERGARDVTVLLTVIAVLTVGSWLYFALLS